MPEVDLRRRRRSSLPAWVLLATLAAAAAAAVWLAASPVGFDRLLPGADPASPSEGSETGRSCESRLPAPPAAGREPLGAKAPASSDRPRRRAARSERRPRAVRTEPIGWWLARIAEGAGRGLVVDPGLDVTVTAGLVDQDWRAGLAALARTVGFSYRVDEAFIEVRAPRPGADGRAEQSGSAEPVRAPVEQSAGRGSGDEQADRGRPPSVIEALPVRRRRPAELAAHLRASARALGVNADADSGSGLLLLSGEPSAVARARQLVARLDLPPRSVMLEAQILELSSKARKELGVQWSVAGRAGAEVDFPAAAEAGEAAALLLSTAGRHAVRARLAALEADGRVRVVSRPKVVVMEGRPASIESVRVLRIRLPDRTALVEGEDTLRAVGGTRAVEEIPVGVSLEVSPTALGDGRVALAVKAKSSTLGPPQPPDGIPEEFSRSVEADILVADGQTAVLGGLMRQGSSDSGSGVPGLRALPVLGRLFGRRRKESESEELLFLITPSLVSLPEDAAVEGDASGDVQPNRRAVAPARGP